jgi:hypothetical protein
MGAVSTQGRIRGPHGDVASSIAAGLLGIAYSGLLASRLPFRFDLSFDVFFDADTSRVFSVMTDGVGARASVHPLFGLIAHGPTAVLMNVGVSEHLAARTVLALTVGLNLVVFHLLVRAVGWRGVPAWVLTTLFLATSGAVYFFSTIETYAFGSLGILLPALLVVRRPRGPMRFVLWVGAGLLAIGVTVTHFMVALVSLAFSERLRVIACLLLAIGLVSVIGLGVQARWLPEYRSERTVDVPLVGMFACRPASRAS